jgi:branched-chain amino acid aminotransferase/4-amino-4-deoxychorismate lyase
MQILLDGNLIPDSEFRIPLNDRAFRYGDGLFETILMLNGQVRLLDYHVNRLKRGLDLLRINSGWLSTERMREEITQLTNACGINHNARIKLMVWRKDGGLYAPSTQNCHYLINAHLLTMDYTFFGILDMVGISKNVRNQNYELSGQKTISAIRYILAGLEKNEEGWDDIILMNENGYVSEGLQSNIFFVKNDFFLTPSLETGCVDGIMRRFILDTLGSTRIRTGEVTFDYDDLMEAEQVFLCNASGIRLIKNIDNKAFSTRKPAALIEVFKAYEQAL